MVDLCVHGAIRPPPQLAPWSERYPTPCCCVACMERRGANCYEKIKFRRDLPAGDGVLYYLGQVFSSSNVPVASLRLERILNGLQDIEYLKLHASRYGRAEGLVLFGKTGVYLGPERYTLEHAPIVAIRGEIYNA